MSSTAFTPLGPAGPPGPSAFTAVPANQTASGITLPFTFGAAITIGQAVYVDTAGQVQPATATDATKLAVGIALATASSGVHDVLVFGIYRDDSNLTFATLGGLVFLGTAAGTLTETAPSGTGNAIQPLGVALASHIVLVVSNFNYLTHA